MSILFINLLCKLSTGHFYNNIIRRIMKNKSTLNNMSKIDTSIYKCLSCNNDSLIEQSDSYCCNKCGAQYHIMFGVPLFLKGVNIIPSNYKLTIESAEQICNFTNLSRNEIVLKTLQEIFTYNYHFNDLNLDAENNYFFNRVPLPENMKRLSLKNNQEKHPINLNIRFSFISHFIPTQMSCKQLLTKNIRLINRCNSIISSKVCNPIMISYCWYNYEGAVKIGGSRKTPLPIDLFPGRAITIPLLICTPDEPGLYKLEVFLDNDEGRLLDGNILNIDIQIQKKKNKELPKFWKKTKKPQDTYNYQEDHRNDQELVFKKVRRYIKSFSKNIRILEVGGCCNPMMRGIEADIYNIDIDVQTLQIGQLSVTDPQERLQFIAADVCELPFVEHCFDFVVMFSSLHHFVNPDKVLKYLTRFLKPGGLMAIMCEPVGYYIDGKVSTEFIKELEHGINEQIFTAKEYHEMFTNANLYPEEVIIDRGSLKAILKTKSLIM